ncbi:TPA: hypothetical protein ACH3X1_000542 [Trebouxia sp. C0004]
MYGPQAAYKAWNPTFEQYLATELSPQFNCTFTVVPLLTETAVYDAVGNATIDLIYSNSGMHVCLEEQYQVASMASLISWQANADAVSYGAAMVTLANRTDINTLQDVVGKTVEIGSLSLVAGLEAQVYALQSAGINLFVSAKQVYYLQNIEQGVDDLLGGLADIIFVRADLMENLQTQGLVTVSSFKVLAQTYIAGYPWPVTAPLGLYPEYSFDCLPHVDYELRKAITEALFRIDRSDYAAQAGGYAGWTTPYSYNIVRTLQQDIGLLKNGSCLGSNEIGNLITCAAGQIKLPLDQLRMQCAREGLHCPEGYGCFCSPCVPQPPSAAASAFGGLKVSGFAVIMTVMPSLMVVAILLVCFYTIWKHRINSSIPNAIAYSELHIGTHSEVLGEGAHGLILKGAFCGVAVSVKRLLAPSNPAYPSAFDFEVNSKKSLEFGAGAAYLARTKSSTSQIQASPSPNKTQRRRNSFLELVSDNLQVWSGKVPGSAQVTIRPTASSTHAGARSRLRTAWAQLQCFLSNNLPWGDAGTLRDARRRAMNEVAQRMQLRHPNIATVMGVATEPVTEDPLMVMVCPERGALSSVIHNETVEMDNEMVVTILKDVAMGMKFLHFSKTPSQDEELTPNRILLDSNYRAQLMHFQLQAVYSQPPYCVIVKSVVLVGRTGMHKAGDTQDLSCKYLAHRELESVHLSNYQSTSHAPLVVWFIVMARASSTAIVVCHCLNVPEAAKSKFSALLGTVLVFFIDFRVLVDV